MSRANEWKCNPLFQLIASMTYWLRRAHPQVKGNWIPLGMHFFYLSQKRTEASFRKTIVLLQPNVYGTPNGERLFKYLNVAAAKRKKLITYEKLECRRKVTAPELFSQPPVIAVQYNDGSLTP